MNATKPANAVVALADLLATTVQEYEQKFAELQDALKRVSAQNKTMFDELTANEQRIVTAIARVHSLERGMRSEVQSATDAVQIGSRDVVSRWLKEIAECLTQPLSPAGPNGGPNKPPT